MWETFEQIWRALTVPLITSVNFIIGFTYAHLLTWIGFILGLLIIGKMLNEKRNPSNIFAWALAVFLIPWVGVPLYFLLGGRKSASLVKRKRRVMEEIRYLAGQSVPEKDLKAMRKTTGNSCELLDDGPATFNALMEGIENSKEAVHIMTYILTKDEAGIPIVEALCKKAREGVEVRLLMDAFGCLGNGRKWIQSLQQAGAEVSRFMPLLPLHSHSSANLRNHRKLALFDHRIAITGGQNIDKRFIGPETYPETFRDFSIRIEGPIVRHLNYIFLDDWLFSSGQNPKKFHPIFEKEIEPCGDRALEVIESGPEISTDPLYERIVEMVQDSREEIKIITPYFVPDEVLFRSLQIKAQGGRRVQILLPQKSNQKLVDLARFHYLRKLWDSGVEIKFYQPGMMHAKLLLVDHKIALTGSANFDMRSLFVNFEMGIVHTSEADIKNFYQWADGIEAKSTLMPENYASTGRGRRLAEDFAHLMGPLL